MWMSIERAAEHLGCGKRTLWRQVGAGEHKSRKAGRRREVWVDSAPAEPSEPPELVSPFELETTGSIPRPELESMAYADAHEQAGAELAELREIVERQAAELEQLRRRVKKLERSEVERQEPGAPATPMRLPSPARGLIPGRPDYDALLARFDGCGMSAKELERLRVIPIGFITKARKGTRRTVKANKTWLKLEAFLDGLGGAEREAGVA